MSHRSRHRRTRLAFAAAAVIALAAPSLAAASPSVFTQTAKVVPAGQTPDATWTRATSPTSQRYLVANNGLSLALRESNGKLDHGLPQYDLLPSAYRKFFTPASILSEGDSGAQPHATCDVPELTDPAVVLGWQGAEPVYGYIPFQATSAGLGDDPATWLGKVKDATGLTLTSTTNLATACSGLGGTFVPADEVVTTAATLAAGSTAPLQAKIAELTAASAEKASAGDKAKAKAEADVKRLTLEAAPLVVKVPSSATLQRGLEVNLTGPPNRAVFVRIQVDEKTRKALKLKYKTLGTGTGTLAANGKGPGDRRAAQGHRQGPAQPDRRACRRA